MLLTDRLTEHWTVDELCKAVDWPMLVANVEALTGSVDTPTNQMWVPKAVILNTVADTYYTSGFNDVIAWDSHWSSATTYRLKMSGVLLPFSSAAGDTRACLEIEELAL